MAGSHQGGKHGDSLLRVDLTTNASCNFTQLYVVAPLLGRPSESADMLYLAQAVSFCSCDCSPLGAWRRPALATQ